MPRNVEPDDFDHQFSQPGQSWSSRGGSYEDNKQQRVKWASERDWNVEK